MLSQHIPLVSRDGFDGPADLRGASTQCDEHRIGGVQRSRRFAIAFDVRVGDRVSFELEGSTYNGRVNRITRRATVLIESPRGEPFSDGRRYLTFYVPLPLLRKQG